MLTGAPPPACFAGVAQDRGLVRPAWGAHAAPAAGLPHDAQGPALTSTHFFGWPPSLACDRVVCTTPNKHADTLLKFKRSWVHSVLSWQHKERNPKRGSNTL